MNNEYVSLIEYLKAECEREYKLFSIADTIELLNRSYFSEDYISQDKFRLIIRELHNDEYIDLKYLDEEVVLLKPLSKSYSIKKQVVQNVQEDDNQDKKQSREWLFFLISFACSFIGAVIGGMIC